MSDIEELNRNKQNFFKTVGSKITRNPWAPIFPVLIYLLIFFIAPIAKALYGSFFDPDFTLKHYTHLFTEPLYLKVILNSFKIGLTVTLCSLVVGYPYAYLLSSIPELIANKLMILVILPFWISILVRNYAWMILLGRYGIINSILLELGLISEPVKILHTSMSVDIAMTHFMLPYMILSLYAIMRGIDRNLLKAAQTLGANWFQAFTKVFLPLSLPGVGGGCLMVFVMSIGFFITPALLGGPKDTMIAQLIEKNVTIFLNWGVAFATAFVLLFITILILLIYNRLLGLDKLWGGVKD